jgi:iron complex outermembrane recepter protein
MKKNCIKIFPAYFVFFFLLSFINNAQAQESIIKLRIITTKKEPVAFASIKIIPVADSVHFFQKLTDSSGTAPFDLIPGLLYRIQVTSVNYKPIDKTIKLSAGQNSFTFIAEEVHTKLDNVVVTFTRPIIRQEDDKTIVDPENIAASSTNAFEIIEKTPGLFVDQDGNIYLSSTTPAQVYINGRELKMAAADVATMLKSLPPNAVATIEILRTPSAKYDASGSGGIVNVVLKKGVRIGLTGSVNAGMNQGKYANRFAGINLNNNNGALSTYLNLQYSKRNNYEQLTTDRLFTPDSLLSQNALTKYPTNSYYAGYGLSYQLNKKWEIDYDGRISFNRFNNSSTNLSEIKKISTNELVTNNNADVANKGNSLNLSQSFSTKYKWDSLGSEWSTDISYTFAPSNSNQDFITFFSKPNIPSTGGDGEIKSRLHFLSGQTNVQWKLPKKITLEGGIKTSYVRFTNNADYFKQSGSLRTKDNFRTALYHYDENINAVYLQGSKNISGIVIKFGTRMENTNMDGQQSRPLDTSFKLNRTDFFPYLYISRNIMRIAGYDLRAYLVYRRTINRPSYELLNPYPRYIDPYLFETGNPSLRPQFTKNYEANISVDERPLFAIGVNDTKDIFTNVIYQADSSHSIAYRTYDNLGTNKEFYLRGLGAIPPGKRYFFVVGAQYNQNFYEGLYESKPLSFKKASWSVFTYHQLKITPVMQMTLSGFARFKGQLQFYELSNFGALNFSINHQFINKKLVVTISANDILFTNYNQFSIQQGTVNATGLRKNDTRRFGLNIRYNFGLRKKEDNNLFNIESPEKTN